MIRRTLALLLAPFMAATRSTASAQQLAPGHPAVFDDAFTNGYTATIDGQAATFQTRMVGTFSLPSGRLVACDPFICQEAAAFAGSVPRGEFPLAFAIADFGGERRLAFARLAFTAAPVVRWELALTEGQDPSTLQPGEIFGYGVDSGTGAFMDLDAWRAFTARMKDDEGWSEQLVDDLDQEERPEWLLLSSGPGSVAMFSSGFGDGFYATYWGYDAAGNLAAALTDFYLVDWNPQPGDG
ncbi:MAG TPA: DUF4241 domain-containing protein [Longimicrobium sp.]|nr:DUF4241 domain-containing protein [Longimicrobium sp.]